MIQIKSSDKQPSKTNIFINSGDEFIINCFYSVPVWNSQNVFHETDCIKPNTDTGFFYYCSTTGKTGSTEPNWTILDSNGYVLDGTILWKPISYDLWLSYTETLTNSVWSCSNTAIILTNETRDNISTSVKVTSIPSSIESFTITNKVTKSSGEILSRTFEYKINK